MSDHLLTLVLVGACCCAALIAIGCLAAIVNVSHLEAEAERERGIDA